MEYLKIKALISFAKTNRDDTIVLGNLANAIFKKEDTVAIFQLRETEFFEQYVDLSLNSFRDKATAEYFYSCWILHDRLQQSGTSNFNLEGLIHEDLHANRAQISYNFYNLLVVNYFSIFSTNPSDDFNRIIVTAKHHFCHLFFTSVQFLTETIEDVVDALGLATQRIKAEDNYLDLNQSMREIGLYSPQVGNLIIERFKDVPEKATLLIPFVFAGLVGSLELEQVFHYAEEFILSSKVDQQILGVRCLTLLHGNEPDLQPFEKKISDLYNYLVNDANESVVGEVVNSYGVLIDKLEGAKNKLLTLCASNSSIIQAVTARVLWMHSDKQWDTDWFKQCLNYLLRIEEQNIPALRNLEMVFIGLEKHAPNRVYAFFESYLLQNDRSAKAIKGFEDTFLRMASGDLSTFQRKLSEWLNHDQPNFQLAAEIILSMLWTHRIHDIYLDKEYLEELGNFDIEYMMYKVLGYIDSKEHLERLLFSLLDKTTIDPNLVDVIIELYTSYVVLNYPSSIRYLESRRAYANHNQLKLIEYVVEASDSYSQDKGNKPNELKHSNARLKVLVKRRFGSQKTEKDPFKKTTILDLVHHISLKNGKRYFSRIPGEFGSKFQYSMKSEMNVIESSFDFPSGEFIDPIGQAYNRFIWRNFKRRSA